MKSNIEKVYSKLPQKKHNFKNQKIALSLIGDIERLTNDVRNNATELDNLIVEIYDLCFKAIEKGGNLDSLYNELENNSKELEEKNTSLLDAFDEIGVVGMADESINAKMTLENSKNVSEEYNIAREILDLLNNKI